MDSQNNRSRGHGSRYRERSRSNEPPVRRRSAYSPDSPDRPYRGRTDNGRERGFRRGFDSRRRDGRRHSRFDPSPPRHRRHSDSEDDDSPPRRRHRNYRDSAGEDFRPRSTQTSRPGTSELGQRIARNPTPASPTPESQAAVDGQEHSYTNGPMTSSTPYNQPAHPPPTAEHNHIPLPNPGMTNHFPPPEALPPDFYQQYHQHNVIRMGYAPGAPSGAQGTSSRDEEADEEEAIQKIMEDLKATGLVDKFRKTFLDECESRPDYIRLSDRVNGTVNAFLETRTWLPESNRNTERAFTRRRVLESSYFAKELDKMLDKCFSEAESYFMPAIDDCVNSYLGIPKTKREGGAEGDEGENEVKIEEGQGDEEEEEESEEEDEEEQVDEESILSQASSMDVDTTEEESEAEEEPPLPKRMPLPPPPPQLGSLGLRSFYPSSLIPGQLGHYPSFLPPTSIAHLVPNHPPPPPLPRPLGLEGRHIPILSNTIITRNLVEPPPLPPTDDDDDDDEPPPPPSDETDTESEHSESESEELSVGDRSPVMGGAQSPEPDSEEESPPPLPPGEEDNESQGPASPSPVKIPYEFPREIPTSPPPPAEAPPVEKTSQFGHKSKELLARRYSSESQESPQPPPPGEEDVELPDFYFQREVASEQTEVPMEVELEQEPEGEIALPTEPEVEVPTEQEQEIPPPKDAGGEEEIPPPRETGQEIQGVVEMDLDGGKFIREIPLPVEEVIVSDDEIPLVDEADEEISLPPGEDEESVGPTSSFCSKIPFPPAMDVSLPPSIDIPLPPPIDIPLPRSIDIPLPPSIDVPFSPSMSIDIPLPPSIDIPLPSDPYARLSSFADDLSPVTPGDLDVSDDSLSEIPLPPTPPSNQIQLAQPLSPPSPLPLEIDLPPPVSSSTPEEAEISSTIEVEQEESPCNRHPGTESPSNDLIQMPPPPPPPPIVPNDPVNPDILAGVSVGFRPGLPRGIPDPFGEDEDDEELESPAFETFGETSPPRIDKVEEESFENLIHNVSPQKLFPPSLQRVSSPPPPLRIDEGQDKGVGEAVKVKEPEREERKSSSSRRHSSSSGSRSHRKSSESHRRHSSSHSTSKSEKKEPRERDKSDSHRHRSSHKRSHGDKDKSGGQSSGASSSSSRRESRGSSIGKHKKRDKDKERHRSRSSRKHSETDTPQHHPPSATSTNQLGPFSEGSEQVALEEKEVPTGSRLIDGEWLEPVRWLDVVSSLEMKMRYYSKYTDPLLMDEDVSLDGGE